MQSRTLVIIGIISVTLGVALVAAWVVSAAMSLDDSALRLSVFEPHAGGCAWYQESADGKDEKEVTRFSVDCSKVQVSWNLSGDAALVWFPDDELASQDELLYLVDIKNRKSKRLIAADPGDPQIYAFADDGRVLAFTENQQINVITQDDPPGTEIEFQGMRYPSAVFPEGQDVLVHALELKGAGWQIDETKASRCCADGAPGIGALSTYQTYLQDDRLAARQSRRLLSATSHFVEIPSTSAVIDQVRDKLKINDANDAPWFSWHSKGWNRDLVFRATRTGERLVTGVAVFRDGNSLQKIPGFNYRQTDVLQVMAHGRYLLITEWGSGMHPHLYDMQTGQLLYSSTVAAGVTFWPEPWKESSKTR